MRVVVQRVQEASVSVAGRTVGEIGTGLLVLVGFTEGDARESLEWMASKLAGLRIFPDDEGLMNRDVRESGGEMLLVSQFTLFGDCRKGRRPNFSGAAPPEHAQPTYLAFCKALRAQGADALLDELHG